ncbi:MAG: TIGR03768 family metallophosphoesterase [Actinomycetes bacterium]
MTTSDDDEMTGFGGGQGILAGYPIADEVVTTQRRTIVPGPAPSGSDVVLPYEVSKYKSHGYGNWSYGPGLAHERRMDLIPDEHSAHYMVTDSRLLSFFTMSDIHICDKESPVQLIFYGYKGGFSSAYSPVMLYTTQVLDAAVQTINALHKQTPFDFGISLGDAANNTQLNELRWYIDVLDGGPIIPQSGNADDPIPGLANDYQDAFEAVGLDKSIPWYQALGNHDQFMIGTLPVNDYIRAHYTGTEILNLGNLLVDHPGVDSRGFYMGAIDGSTPDGDVFGAGPVSDFAVPPQVSAADPNRRSLTKSEWMAEFFYTSSLPIGHGFNRANTEDGFACYSFLPNRNIPIKVIVLDDTQDPSNPDVDGYGHGYIDTQRYDWLLAELERGQAEDQLMIIAAHVPIGVENPGSYIGWSPIAPITEEQFIAKLQTYPNLIAWLAGHRHYNAVTAMKSPDPSRPELGFWQIETSSLRDFPQQFRTFTISRNSDNTISITTTNVDPAVEKGSLAAQSRFFAVAAQQIFDNKVGRPPSGSYNAELVIPLSPRMQQTISNCGTALLEWPA